MSPFPTQSTGCAMLVPGYGVIRLHATGIMYGLSIVASESKSRHRKAMYVKAKTSGLFTLDLAFYTYAEWAEFARVMLHYGNNLSRGIVGSPCRVLIPSVIDAKTKKPLDRTGIPESPIPWGDEAGVTARRMSLRFLGTSDHYNPTSGANVGVVSNLIDAEYQGVIKRDPQAAYFYPSGTQLSGKGYGVDTLYDSVPGESAFHVEETVPRSSTRGGHQEF